MKHKLSILFLGASLIFLSSFVSVATAQTATSCFTFSGWTDCTPGAEPTPYYTTDPVTGASTPTITWSAPTTLGEGGTSGGTTPSTGVYWAANAGGYFNTNTGKYSTNPNGTCVPNVDICGTTWEEFNSAKILNDAQKFNVVPDSSMCATGTVNRNPNPLVADTCLLAGSLVSINICKGTETTGVCSLEKVNLDVATEMARRKSIETGQSCHVDTITWPGVPTLTGLNYSYSVDCSSGSGSSGGGSAGSSTGTRTNYFGSGSTLSGSGSYANNLLSIARSIINNLNAIIQSTPGQTTIRTTATTPSIVSPASITSNSRILQIISQANVLPYGSLTSNEQIDLTNYLAVNRTALIDQNFQVFAPGSVFAWSLSMGTSTTLNSQAQSLGFTTLNPLTFMFVKTPSATTATTTVPVSATTNANICCSFIGWYECGGSIPSNPSPTLTPYYINGVSTLGTRQCGVQPAAVTTAPVYTQPVITTPVSTPTSTITFPATITVTAELLRIRTEPNTTSRQINSFQRRATFIAGNIVPGENIEGNNQWFLFIYGTMPAYAWSGGTAQSPIAPATMNFPVTVTVISTLPLYVRGGSSTDAVPVTQLREGDTFSASGIVDGESVEGNNKWWVFLRGSVPVYVWSGGAAVIH